MYCCIYVTLVRDLLKCVRPHFALVACPAPRHSYSAASTVVLLQGYSALHVAAEGGHADAMALLLSHSKDPNPATEVSMPSSCTKEHAELASWQWVEVCVLFS